MQDILPEYLILSNGCLLTFYQSNITALVPRLSMQRTARSNSGVVISFIGQFPIQGNISFSKRTKKCTL